MELNAKIDYNPTTIYTDKIIGIKDNKLAETNYKILYKILPCGVNLKKWKKKDSDICDICNKTETIQHLIYECQYAKFLWSKIEKALNTNISLLDIVFGKKSQPDMNMFISLVVYLIYKEWITYSMNFDKRPTSLNMNKYTQELITYKKIYNASQTLMKYTKHIEITIEYLSSIYMIK